MRIYFDTEFIKDGMTIDLLSIGLVATPAILATSATSEATK